MFFKASKLNGKNYGKTSSHPEEQRLISAGDSSLPGRPTERFSPFSWRMIISASILFALALGATLDRKSTVSKVPSPSFDDDDFLSLNSKSKSKCGKGKGKGGKGKGSKGSKSDDESDDCAPTPSPNHDPLAPVLGNSTGWSNDCEELVEQGKLDPALCTHDDDYLNPGPLPDKNGDEALKSTTRRTRRRLHRASKH